MINSVIITDLSTAVSASFKEDKENVWVSAVDKEDQNKIRMMKRNFSKRNIPHFAQYFYDWSDEDNDFYIQNNIEKKDQENNMLIILFLFYNQLWNLIKFIILVSIASLVFLDQRQ